MLLKLPFLYREKIFVGEKWRNFGWVKKIFPDEKFCPMKVLPDKIFPYNVIVFPKSVVTPSKIRTVINVYAKALAFIGQITFSRNSENDWNKNVNFKVILMGENSYLQMYRNNISFLTYWFLRIKWLFPKSVKIT